MSKDAGAFFNTNHYTSVLSPLQRASLVSHATLLQLPRGKEIWSAGDPADMVYFVRSGLVKLSRRTAEGRELTLHLFQRGDIFGQVAPLSGTARQTDAMTYRDSVLSVLPARRFLELMGASHEFSSVVTQTCAQRRQRVEERIQTLLFKTADSRLATLYLELAGDFGVRDSRGVILNIRLTHKDMASMIGSTRETVSFAIQDLREAGLIHTESMRVVILDEEGLKALAAK